MSEAFLHNWLSHVRVTTSYLTQIEQSRALSQTAPISEERIALRSRPLRSINCAWFGVKKAETFRASLYLMRLAQDASSKFPLYCDQAKTTASSSGTTINCPTADRRFKVGADVLIFHLGTDGRPTQPEFKTVSAIGGSTLTLSGALTYTHPTGSFVFPCLVVEPSLGQSMRMVTDELGMFEGEVFERDEDALAGLVDAHGAPGSFGAQDSDANDEADADTPIFDVSPNWITAAQQAIARDGARINGGRSGVVLRQNSRPRFEHEFSLRFFSRADVFSCLQFFDSRSGRLLPFWLLHPMSAWTATAVASGYVEVSPGGSTTDILEFCEYIAVKLKNGTIHIRKLSSVSDVGNYRLNIVGTFTGFVVGDIDRVTIASFVRFSEDSFVEDWFTDAIADVKLRFVEVLNELADEGLSVPIG